MSNGQNQTQCGSYSWHGRALKHHGKGVLRWFLANLGKILNIQNLVYHWSAINKFDNTLQEMKLIEKYCEEHGVKRS